MYIIGEPVPGMGGNIMSRIEIDKKNFFMNGDKLGLSSCKLILGEIQRDPNKDYSDENATKILRSLRKITEKNPEPDTLLLQLIDTYIPGPVSDLELFSKMVQLGYNDEVVKEMGKKAYSIIAIMKKVFEDREINSKLLRSYIDTVIENG